MSGLLHHDGYIMAYRVFTLPVREHGAAETELNGYLTSHRVLSVDRRFVEEGERSFWAFCVDFVDAGRGSSSASAAGGTWKRDRTDYREVRSAEDFAVFAKLREIRKAIAQAEGVPVYTIFTNEQLAQIVQARATSKSALEQVVGVGDGRVAKYGERILEWLRQQWGGKESDAASQPACRQWALVRCD
jgi:superfamily II DNA helicase RecQ